MTKSQTKNKSSPSKTPLFDRQRRNKFVLAILGVSLIVVLTFVMSRPRSEAPAATEPDSNPATAVDISLPGNIQFEKDGELVFLTAGGLEISQIDIEIAETSLKVTQGMMYRTDLGADQGMLFIFPFERPQSFWMKNTHIPLDIIFVNANLRIVTIQNDAVPFDESSYPSTEPAKFVIEVNAGYAEKHGIKVGDTVKWTETL